MAQQDGITAGPVLASDAPVLPVIRRLSTDDLYDALRRGLDDFRAMPTHAVFISLIYPVVGLLLARVAFGYDIMPLLYPLAAGFALIGPFAAIGLYEMSRRREMGLETSWEHAFDVFRSPSLSGILALGLLLLIIFGLWIAVANALYVACLGYQQPASVSDFLRQVFTTSGGHALIVLGNGIGFLFAVGVLAISAVSFPLLLDRQVSAMAAIATSIRVVAKNPTVMALWGLIVAVLLLIGSLPLFFGLAVVMPVLGHATWHLYRKAVVADGSPRNEPRPPNPRGRYAADFPLSLFARTREEER
jgi:uncharacterized membrane protein